MTPAFIFFTQQEGAETNIHPYIGIDDERISILYTVRNILGHVTSIYDIQVHFEIFIVGQIILQE